MTDKIQSIDLNQGQAACSDAFFKFLLGEGKIFRISGPAGVGKTFMMKHIMNKILPQYYDMCKLLGIDAIYNSIEMTATTNKAADQLSQATGRLCPTIHSFLGLKVKPDFNSGTTKLERIPSKWQIHTHKVIVIDEASMIDHQLKKHLYESTSNCKIVYVGDRDQLPPVFEDLSEVYKEDGPLYELLEPMRNNGQPALMALCAQFRKTVQDQEFKPINIIPGVIDHLNDDQLVDVIEDIFNGGPNSNQSARILAFTNERVITYNDHIRTLRNMPDQFQEGETLVSASAVQFKTNALSVEEEVTITKIYRHTQVDIDAAHDVYMDVMEADIEGSLHGPIYNVKIPTNYGHFTGLIEHYRKNKRWKEYYELQEKYPMLRQKDASTVHKAQGSTYDSVIIDLTDISRCRKANELARMLYVAVSRPRTRIYFYGSLPEKYGGTPI